MTSTIPSPLARLVLASASPRRLALLAQAGITPAHVLAPEVDETPERGELPRAYVERLALAKAEAGARAYPEHYVLAADTAVACGRRILPKAEDARTAETCLRLLSGRRHRVYTAVALRAPEGKIARRTVMTHVAFKRLTEVEIAAYLAGGEWRGKAGGYAIQGAAAALIPAINGSYSNVVGLPLYETVGLLRGVGML